MTSAAMHRSKRLLPRPNAECDILRCDIVSQRDISERGTGGHVSYLPLVVARYRDWQEIEEEFAGADVARATIYQRVGPSPA